MGVPFDLKVKKPLTGDLRTGLQVWGVFPPKVMSESNHYKELDTPRSKSTSSAQSGLDLIFFGQSALFGTGLLERSPCCHHLRHVAFSTPKSGGDDLKHRGWRLSVPRLGDFSQDGSRNLDCLVCLDQCKTQCDCAAPPPELLTFFCFFVCLFLFFFFLSLFFSSPGACNRKLPGMGGQCGAPINQMAPGPLFIDTVDGRSCILFIHFLMHEIVHHFETMGSHCLLVFTGVIIIPGFLRWCRISTIHSVRLARETDDSSQASWPHLPKLEFLFCEGP